MRLLQKLKGHLFLMMTLKRHTSRYTHETVALGFSVTEEAVEDNLYDRLFSLHSCVGSCNGSHKQVKAASILNNAFTAGASAGGDGVAFVMQVTRLQMVALSPTNQALPLISTRHLSGML